MSKPPIPAVILVRVSTVKQDTDRQVTELRAVATSRGWEVVEVLEETVSGRADQSERSGLHRAEELALTGKIKKVLVHEVSRVARPPLTLPRQRSPSEANTSTSPRKEGCR